MADISFQQKVVNLVQCASEMGARLEKQAQDKQAQEVAVNDLIPRVVDALIKHDRIEADLRKDAEAALRDPVRVLEILANTAAHRTPGELNHLGSPVETADKKASFRALGARHEEKSEADKAFEMSMFGRLL